MGVVVPTPVGPIAVPDQTTLTPGNPLITSALSARPIPAQIAPHNTLRDPYTREQIGHLQAICGVLGESSFEPQRRLGMRRCWSLLSLKMRDPRPGIDRSGWCACATTYDICTEPLTSSETNFLAVMWLQSWWLQKYPIWWNQTNNSPKCGNTISRIVQVKTKFRMCCIFLIYTTRRSGFNLSSLWI